MSATSAEERDNAVYTAGRVRVLLWEWGELERGELGHQAHGDAGLGTPILASKRGSRPPLRIELFDLAGAVLGLGDTFERAVIWRWYARGRHSMVPLGLADPFTRTDVLDESPNYIADVRGMDAPDAGERVAADLGYRWRGRVVNAYDVTAACNRGVERLARALRLGVYDPRPVAWATTNYHEILMQQLPGSRQVIEAWLDGYAPRELAAFFGRSESSIRYILRRFRRALHVVEIALAAVV
jgi:hypothetical protein